MLLRKYWLIPIVTKRYWSVYAVRNVNVLVNKLIANESITEYVATALHVESLTGFH